MLSLTGTGFAHKQLVIHYTNTGRAGRGSNEGPGEGTHTARRRSFHFLEHPVDREAEHHFHLKTHVHHEGAEVMLSFGQRTEGMHNVMFCVFHHLDTQVGVLECLHIPVVQEVSTRAA